MNTSTSAPLKKRKYNAIYRVRRKGVEVNTAQRTIYRAYTGAGVATSSAERILASEYHFGIQLIIN